MTWHAIKLTNVYHLNKSQYLLNEDIRVWCLENLKIDEWHYSINTPHLLYVEDENAATIIRLKFDV